MLPSNEKEEAHGRLEEFRITVGYAEYEKDMSLEQWVDLADEKMYSGKNTGKNKTVR